MDFTEARKAYENDPKYKALVEMLVHQIIQLELTPSEIRQAAVFASVRANELVASPMVVIDKADLTDGQLREFLKNPQYLVM